MKKTKRIGWSLAALLALADSGLAATIELKPQDELAAEPATALEDPLAEKEEIQQESGWIISVGPLGIMYETYDSALTHRRDYDSDEINDWENGTSDGGGWGARVFVGKEQEGMELTISESDMDYDRTASHDYLSLKSYRLDTEISYLRAVAGVDEVGSNGLWGWNLGLRWLKSDEDLEIKERGRVWYFDGDNNWYMGTGGYFGTWRPFGGYLKVYGRANFLFGHVAGLSRRGNDLRLDYRIQETYQDASSLCYGLNFGGGVGADFGNAMNVQVGWRGDWLYSFESTDTGIVVFPDNDDALFINNTTYFFGAVSLLF